MYELHLAAADRCAACMGMEMVVVGLSHGVTGWDGGRAAGR